MSTRIDDDEGDGLSEYLRSIDRMTHPNQGTAASEISDESVEVILDPAVMRDYFDGVAKFAQQFANLNRKLAKSMAAKHKASVRAKRSGKHRRDDE